MQKRYVVLEKQVGETPLAALQKYQSTHLELADTPLAYAGRLDPMAEGKLLILIGEECKKQTTYHGLDKEYEFSVLFGVSSDTGDVLGRIEADAAPQVSNIQKAVRGLRGNITLSYPHFSSRTVHGKPLHVWTLEGRLDEIEVPTYTTKIYALKLMDTETKTGTEISEEALTKIETIPPVTEASKKLGRDFRRADVREDWRLFREMHGNEVYTIATFRCVSGSGAYMRTLAEEIARNLGTRGLAYSIKRTKIGRYWGLGFWGKQY